MHSFCLLCCSFASVLFGFVAILFALSDSVMTFNWHIICVHWCAYCGLLFVSVCVSLYRSVCINQNFNDCLIGLNWIEQLIPVDTYWLVSVDDDWWIEEWWKQMNVIDRIYSSQSLEPKELPQTLALLALLILLVPTVSNLYQEWLKMNDSEWLHISVEFYNESMNNSLGISNGFGFDDAVTNTLVNITRTVLVVSISKDIIFSSNLTNLS